MIEFLIQQFYTNEIMQAAVVAAPMTILTYAAKDIPTRIFRYVKHFLTLEITFKSDMSEFDTVSNFVSNSIMSESLSRRFTYYTDTAWDNEEDRHIVKEQGLQVGYGPAIGWYKNRLVLIDRSLEEADATAKFKETLSLTFLTRKRDVLKLFVKEVAEKIGRASEDDTFPIYVCNHDYWFLSGRLPQRKLDTIFLPDDLKNRVVNHIRKFEQSKRFYRERGLPYHTGILLKGPPGTGKTSFIHGLATELGRTIHYLNLSSIDDDAGLNQLLSSRRNWEGTLLVIEDVDATGANVGKRKKKKKKKNEEVDVEDDSLNHLSMSTILNTLDGLLTPDGLVLIATTNYEDRIDDAVLRPGRFDLSLEIGPMVWHEFVKMAQILVPKEDVGPVKKLFKPTSGARLRALLLEEGVQGVETYFKEGNTE